MKDDRAQLKAFRVGPFQCAALLDGLKASSVEKWIEGSCRTVGLPSSVSKLGLVIWIKSLNLLSKETGSIPFTQVSFSATILL